MSRVHRAASEGFQRGAEDYEKGRPSYPAAAVDRLVAETGTGGGTTVVDVGAGTGKFTELLVATGATVIAVEPVAAMREAFTRHLPGVRVLDGTAEATSLADRSSDVVTVAQAFHWFDASRALDEISRVLRPDGWLALIWNTRDPAAPWTATIGSVLDRVAGDAPRFRSDQGSWRAAIESHGAFGLLQEAAFDNPVPMDLETMLARVASTSYVSALPDDRRREVLAEVEDLVRRGPMAEEGPGFVERYRTELYWCRRR